MGIPIHFLFWKKNCDSSRWIDFVVANTLAEKKLFGESLFRAIKTYSNPHSTEYCGKMSEIFPIFHCDWNIVATFLSNIAKYFILRLQCQLSEIFLKTNKYLILSEIM